MSPKATARAASPSAASPSKATKPPGSQDSEPASSLRQGSPAGRRQSWPIEAAGHYLLVPRLAAASKRWLSRSRILDVGGHRKNQRTTSGWACQSPRASVTL